MARIVHVSESLATGVLTVLSTLVRAQMRDGHDVTLMGSQLRSDTPHGWRNELPPDLRFVDLPMQREIRPRDDLRGIVRLWKELHARKPDVVHLHSSKAGALGRVACLPSRATVVYQPHGLAYLRRDVSRSSRLTYEWIERLLSMLGGTVVACSEGELAALEGVVPRSRSAVVVNGIDFSAVPLANVEAGRVRIGTSGRISAQKRPDFFADVARRLRHAADFVWIGDGDEAGKARLVAEGVQVTGWRTREESLREIGGLQIYVQTSAWEGMPVSVIEAMAAGLPIVATDVVGNRDLLANTDAGLLVDTPQAMASALGPLVEGAQRRKRVGLAARERAQALYSAETMVRTLYGVYGIHAVRHSARAAPVDVVAAAPVAG